MGQEAMLTICESGTQKHESCRIGCYDGTPSAVKRNEHAKYNNEEFLVTEHTGSLESLGFTFGRGGVHLARTMMLNELTILLDHESQSGATRDDYRRAIEEDNCLGKRSGKTRSLTYRHLIDLYSLDPDTLLFRALLYFWQRDSDGRPLLALLCTYARDGVFRPTAPLVLKTPIGTTVTSDAMGHFIDGLESERFSAATLKSTAQNVNSTWTQSRHLTGRAKKVRRRAMPTTGSVSYALLLGYLTGERGYSLFQTEYAQLLDCTIDRAIELAGEASRKGWIVLKQAGDVIEVLFPNLINSAEMELLREQN